MLTGVVAFLLLLIALLAVPVTLTFKMSWQQSFQSDITLFWLFGLVRVQISSPQTKAPSLAGKELSQKIDSHVGPSSRAKQNVFSVVQQKAFRRRITKFLNDVWRAVHKNDINLCVRLGLDDPADTGQLWAVIGPVAGLLSNVKEATIEIVPEFLIAPLN